MSFEPIDQDVVEIKEILESAEPTFDQILVAPEDEAFWRSVKCDALLIQSNIKVPPGRTIFLFKGKVVGLMTMDRNRIVGNV